MEQVRPLAAGADPVWATLEAAGDRWTFLIVREAFFGVRRFVDLQRNLGIARTPLSERLNHLTASGVLERVQYQERPVRHEYRLTEMGLDLYPLIVAMLRFGEKWLRGDAEASLRHRGCGGDVELRLQCAACGEEVDAKSTDYSRTPPDPSRS